MPIEQLQLHDLTFAMFSNQPLFLLQNNGSHKVIINFIDNLDNQSDICDNQIDIYDNENDKCDNQIDIC